MEDKKTISESEAKKEMENAEEIELTEKEVQENLENAEILEVVPDETREVQLTPEEIKEYVNVSKTLSKVDDFIIMVSQTLDRAQRDWTEALKQKRTLIKNQKESFDNLCKKYEIEMENIKSFDIPSGKIVEVIIKKEEK